MNYGRAKNHRSNTKLTIFQIYYGQTMLICFLHFLKLSPTTYTGVVPLLDNETITPVEILFGVFYN